MLHSAWRIGRRALCALAVLTVLSAIPARAVTKLSPSGQDDSERLAEAKARVAERALGHYGMTPVYGRDVRDGDYDVKVESNSAFFRITKAVLHASGGTLTADITIGSLSYARVFMGAAEDAEAADEWIEGEADGGTTVFTVPVPALNAPFDCAAWSVNRERWYDRQLLIDAAALPADALAFELPDYALIERAIKAYAPDEAAEASVEDAAEAEAPEPVGVDWPDGEYAIEVNLAGGSGRASVSSPTLMVVRDGRAFARLLWSSPYYDYMVVGGAVYENLTLDGGNSTFEIPITAMDAPMAVVADTTAMGEPVEISYALTFYADTVGDKSQVPQEAAKQVLAISLAIIVLGAILNHFVKKKRK